jgi:parallel beta-helix repeat protein
MMPTIREFLCSLGLEHYADRFEAEEISVADLGELTEADIKTYFGITRLIDRKRLLQGVVGLSLPSHQATQSPACVAGASPRTQHTPNPNEDSPNIGSPPPRTLAKPALKSNVLVDPRRNGDAETIAEALTIAAPGAVVRLMPGHYRERLDLACDITIEGPENGGEVVIEHYVEPVVRVGGGNPKLQRLSVRSTTLGSSQPDVVDSAALVVAGGEARFEGLTVTSAQSIGVLVRGTSTKAHLRHTHVTACAKHGILVAGGHLTLTNVESLNHAGCAVVVQGSGQLTATDSKFHKSKSFGIGLRDEARCALERCEVFETDTGLDAGGHATVLARLCTFFLSEIGICLSESAKGTLANCASYGNRHHGIYLLEKADVSVTKSSFYGSKLGSGIVCDDESTGKFDGCVSYGNQLAGICVSEISCPTVRGCKFYTCGTGIVALAHSRGTFDNCASYENRGPGMLVDHWADPVVRGCKFHSSKEDVGIRVCYRATGVFEGCESYGNKWGGIKVEGEANPCVRGCIFRA